MFVKQCSIHRSRANYIWEKKTNKVQVHPYKPVSWLPTHHVSSVSTKQACRDELVVYLFFSPIYIYIDKLQRSLEPTAHLSPQRGSLMDSQSKPRRNVINYREFRGDQGRTTL